ncbi:glycosyltransferase [Maribacter luteus]|uniref:Glycosyltransferase n=1 Tax=Maribacter luteus TaxID=2594478 RepID=A0A6I2MMX7_9FLAO|nr:glycosyltransferase [Maribacter luteus]MRX64302.1 glycosyltransferase [Maribacter luteus]
MKVAIIHYWLITRRGGEKVIESILKLYPNADIYTLFLDGNIYGPNLPKNSITTSVLDKPWLRKYYQKIFPLYPIGIKSLKLKDNYDLIISSESGPAKGIKINDSTPHVCYVHSPMRYCWGFTDEYLQSIPKILRPIARFFFGRLREWDITTISNVTSYVVNSENVANRVKTYYGKDSKVIYPPIELSLFDRPLIKNMKRDIYLSFGAITPYKRIDLLIEVFNRNGKELVIIGNGSEKEKLESNANSNIKFLGSLPWNQIEKYLDRTKALIFPGEEDFGMIPLEVMAYGIPVLAFGKGGALETVIENDLVNESSGFLFEAQTRDSIQKCIDKFELNENGFDPEWIRGHAREFGEDKFLDNFRGHVNSLINPDLQ